MLYLVEQRKIDNVSCILEFHRGKAGKTVRVVRNYKPYFFVDSQSDIEKMEGVLSVQPGFKSILGTDIKKVTVSQPENVKTLRGIVEDRGFRTWEADIRFHNRYTVDLPEIVDDGEKLKVMYFDIETNMDKIPPNIEMADQEIVCISSRIGREMTTWMFNGENPGGVRYFSKEEAMLADFISYIRAEDPDIITAWNINNFDLLYLINRCKRLGVEFRRMGYNNDVYVKTFMGDLEVVISGKVVLDMLTAYKLWRKYGNFPQLESYSLNFVAKTVLDKEKKKLDYSINYLWKNDVNLLLEYNRWDVELLSAIDRECKVIDFFDNIRRKCHVQFNDVYKTTAIVDGYLIKRLNKSIILPTATHKEEDTFEGGQVLTPIPGIYNNVLCLDVSGMYPSIIKSCNISYETLGEGIKLPIGTSFTTEPGIIPRFLDELAAERKQFKAKKSKATTKLEKELWHQRQYATKVIMNSMFGYLGFVGSRLYRKECAAAITGMGQDIIKHIVNWSNDNDNMVIYGDTDSIYALSRKETMMAVVKEGAELKRHINKKLDEYITSFCPINYVKTDFEKALKRILFTEAKKRYAYIMLWDSERQFKVDKDVHIVGFAEKRSDTNKIGKLVQYNVIKMMLEGCGREDVLKYVSDIELKMKRREFSDEEIGFPKGITKPLEEYNPPSAIIKGAFYSNKHYNTTFGRGSKPKYVYIKSINGIVPTIKLRVFSRKENKYVDKTYNLNAFTYDTAIPGDVEIDWSEMSRLTFRTKLEKIFECAGWNFDDHDKKSIFSLGG